MSKFNPSIYNRLLIIVLKCGFDYVMSCIKMKQNKKLEPHLLHRGLPKLLHVSDEWKLIVQKCEGVALFESSNKIQKWTIAPDNQEQYEMIKYYHSQINKNDNILDIESIVSNRHFNSLSGFFLLFICFTLLSIINASFYYSCLFGGIAILLFIGVSFYGHLFNNQIDELSDRLYFHKIHDLCYGLVLMCVPIVGLALICEFLFYHYDKTSYDKQLLKTYRKNQKIKPKTVADHVKRNPHFAFHQLLPIWYFSAFIKDEVGLDIIGNRISHIWHYIQNCQDKQVNPNHIFNMDKLNHLLDTIQLLKQEGYRTSIEIRKQLEKRNLFNSDLYIHENLLLNHSSVAQLTNENEVVMQTSSDVNQELPESIKCLISELLQLMYDSGICLSGSLVYQHAQSVGDYVALENAYKELRTVWHDIYSRVSRFPNYQFQTIDDASHFINQVYLLGNQSNDVDVLPLFMASSKKLRDDLQEQVFEQQYLKLEQQYE